jgi:hypothetical protein
MAGILVLEPRYVQGFATAAVPIPRFALFPSALA